MREILFRGRDGSGVWSVGNLLHLICEIRGEITTEVVKIHPIKINGADFPIVVDPATVGQYTLRKDRKGVKIFPGDIVEVSFGDMDKDFGGPFRSLVVEDKQTYFGLQSFGEYSDAGPDALAEFDSWQMTVIGNKWDNPEMLEVDHE